MADVATLAARASAVLGRPVTLPDAPAGGGNNRIYRAEAGGRALALKLYLRQPDDPRDRLGQETAALRFLADNGETRVPRLHGVDAEAGFALYDWIDGAPIDAPDDADVDALAAFAARLHAVAAAPGAGDLADAQASCYCAADAERQFAARLARLEEAADGQTALRDFLDDTLRPAWRAATTRARTRLDAAGQGFDVPLAVERRTLSPSDFGFHNALRGADGAPVFLDFEYFGWDDPVKMTADAMLHLGRPLSPAHRRRFARAMVDAFQPGDDGFAVRLRALYPLYGLIWCLIALNEFLPERWARRVFAGEAESRETAMARQLDRARRLVNELNADNDIDLILE